MYLYFETEAISTGDCRFCWESVGLVRGREKTRPWIGPACLLGSRPATIYGHINILHTQPAIMPLKWSRLNILEREHFEIEMFVNVDGIFAQPETLPSSSNCPPATPKDWGKLSGGYWGQFWARSRLREIKMIICFIFWEFSSSTGCSRSDN